MSGTNSDVGVSRKVAINLDAKTQRRPPDQTDVSEVFALHEDLIGMNRNVVGNDQFLGDAVDDERQAQSETVSGGG